MLPSLLKSRLPWVAVAVGLLVARPAPAWEIPSADRKTPDASLAPVGLRLTGQARREGYPAWHFKIVMHGPDRYYRKDWTVPNDAARGGWSVCLVDGDFSGNYDVSWGEKGRRVGGSSGGGGKGRPEVARKLFAGDKLVGAPRSGPQQEGEEFEALCRRGKLLLPTVIRWLDRQGTETVYHVQQIDVLFQFDKGFIDSIKKKYFR